ncbi:MAG: cobyric acid synthase [Dehalococcoidia bacterium]
MTAPVLMVVGTASSVGKSVLVTALCRIFAQDGVQVAPFKAQNMSNNAAVTADGLEIGRAQAEQAAAAGLEPEVAMNPVLLKPQGDRTSQVVLDGRPAGVLRSSEFIERKRDFWPHVERALGSLRERYDLVVVEGAGSAAEPNLQASDIVNMRVARHAGALTLLVGDIDRGGVFAHFLGTLDLLLPEDRPLVRGLVINRFRGDPSLLQPAIELVEARGGVPVLGVIPWIDRLGVADEDAVALERLPRAGTAAPGEVEVAAIRLPRIANFDDFDPLLREPGVRVRWVESGRALGMPDLILIPGTKATVADLGWLRAEGLDEAISARVATGAHVLGICGGYQMLGERLLDRDGVEAAPGTEVNGLGLLPLTTEFTAVKATQRVGGTMCSVPGAWSAASGLDVRGYEIHMGRTMGSISPLLDLDGRPDGAVSADGRVAGTYLHGLLHNDGVRHALLAGLGRRSDRTSPSESGVARQQAFDRLASTVRTHLDVDAIRAMLRQKT